MQTSQKIDTLVQRLLVASRNQSVSVEASNEMIKLNEQLHRELEVYFDAIDTIDEAQYTQVQTWLESIQQVQALADDARSKLKLEASELNKGRSNVKKYLSNS